MKVAGHFRCEHFRAVNSFEAEKIEATGEKGSFKAYYAVAVINFVHLTFMIVRGFFCSSPALKKNLSVQYRLFYAHNLIAMAIEIDLLNGYKIHESNVHNM